MEVAIIKIVELALLLAAFKTLKNMNVRLKRITIYSGDTLKTRRSPEKCLWRHLTLANEKQ